ncbi:MAG: hypothetical protein U0270_23785 [Labilithrix sp.]
MVDAHDDEGKGTLLFLAWASKAMVWSDVGVAQDESSYALVMKDADADEERGKRMCVPGNLIQISVEKADVGKVHIGLLMSDAGDLYRFLGVRSSREPRGDVRSPREPRRHREPVTERPYVCAAASFAWAAR